MPIATEFDPDLVLVAAGFDAAEGDPLGGCHVTPDCYAQLTSELMRLAGGKVVVALEGGYSLTATKHSAAACMSSLLGLPHSATPPPAPSAAAAAEAAAKAEADAATAAAAKAAKAAATAAAAEAAAAAAAPAARPSSGPPPMARPASATRSHVRRGQCGAGTPSHTFTHPLTPSHTLSHPHTPSHTLTHPHTPSHTLSHPLTPSHTLSHPLTPSHTLTPPHSPHSPHSPCRCAAARQGWPAKPR